MSAHTPGQLNVAVEIFDNDGMPETAIQGLNGSATVAVALDFGLNNPGMREANARRLAACWNACEGLDTDELERFCLGTATGSEIHKLRFQRDELLAAIDGLLNALPSATSHPAIKAAKAARANAMKDEK